MQKHDIIKKRIDSHGNVIETRQDGIGAPKVSDIQLLKIYLLVPKLFRHYGLIDFVHFTFRVSLAQGEKTE